MNRPKFKQTEIGEIPEDWDVQTIADLPIDIIDGDRGINYPKKNEFENRGFCLFLNTKNVPGEHFDFTECDFINEERDRLLRKGKLQKGDIVLTTRGTVGNIAYYHKRIPYEHIRINSGMVIIRNGGEKFDTGYLYHLLKSPLVKQQYLSFATGSAQPQLPIRDINKIKLTVPPILEQHSIAKILSDLDEKIELNHQMNKTLKSIAQAVFKQWFVDFEFPGYENTKFINGLPDGWREGKLIDVCDIVMGQSPPGETYNESGDGIVFYQGNRDFGFRFPVPRVYCTAPTRTAEALDVLISVRAPVGALNITLEKCAIGRGVAALRMKRYSNGFLFYFLSTRKDLWDRFNSEGTVFGCLNKTEFQKIDLIIPSDIVLRQFDTIIKSIEAMIHKNEVEIRLLVEIRDSLLPRLMSGKIKIN